MIVVIVILSTPFPNPYGTVCPLHQLFAYIYDCCSAFRIWLIGATGYTSPCATCIFFLLNVIDDRAIHSIQPVSLSTPGHHSDLKSFDMRFIETYQLAYSHVPIARVARLRRIEGPVLSTLSSICKRPTGTFRLPNGPPSLGQWNLPLGALGVKEAGACSCLGTFFFTDLIFLY